MVAIVLHDLQDLNLMGPEASAITVNEVSKKVHEFALVEALLVLILDMLADKFDQLEDSDFLIEHSFVIIIHFLQEIDAPNVLLDVMDHLGDVPLHPTFDLVEVFNQRHDVVVAHVQEFQAQVALRQLAACEDEVQDLRVQV